MTYILLPFERRTLESVTRAFAYLSDHYNNREVVDWTMVLSSEQEVSEITQKLQACLLTDSDLIRVAMNRNDFYTYMNLVMFTPRILPPLLHDDIDVLEMLEEQQNWEYYEDILTPRKEKAEPPAAN